LRNSLQQRGRRVQPQRPRGPQPDRLFGFVSNLDLNYVGYAIVGLFVVTWISALSVWRFGRIEEKWTAGLRSAAPQPTEVGSRRRRGRRWGDEPDSKRPADAD